MADSGIFRINPLQGWQRDAIQKAAQLMRDRFGNPPDDAQARAAHDGLLEVLDPARRTARLQKQLREATSNAVGIGKTERRAGERRTQDRRRANLGPPTAVPERRKGERRVGERRRRK